MDTIGVRDLKDRLSEVLRRVRRGESFLVSRRGEVVAEVRMPYGSTVLPGLDSGLALLAEKGDLVPGAPNDPEVYPELDPLLPAGEVVRLLDEERGPR